MPRQCDKSGLRIELERENAGHYIRVIHVASVWKERKMGLPENEVSLPEYYLFFARISPIEISGGGGGGGAAASPPPSYAYMGQWSYEPGEHSRNLSPESLFSI